MTTIDSGNGAERVQKILARAGYGSRRACEDLIRLGVVKVNGRTCLLGDRADPARETIEVRGVAVRVPELTVVYLLNKPIDVVTTAHDPQGRPTVLDLVPAEPRVFPAGRLDLDTEGLLILTNDGDLAQKIAHPKHELEKVYVATVDGQLPDAALNRLRRGIELEDGVATAKEARVLATAGRQSLVEIRVTMGRKRVVRRMLEAVGHPARRLVRTAIGPLRDPGLVPGEWRLLEPREVIALERAAHGVQEHRHEAR